MTVIVVGALEAVYGQLSVGEFVAFASYNTALVWPIRGLGRILSDMSKAGVSFDRVDYIIRGEEEEYAKDSILQRASERKEGASGIRFSHVNFSYEKGQEVLSDVSFEVPGERPLASGRNRKWEIYDCPVADKTL